jgi:hypothetical protein
MSSECDWPPGALRSFLRSWVVLVIALTSAISLPAQVFNNWINPNSGPWEDTGNWSVGIRPAANQSVVIGNAGYKAVGISSSTASIYPASLTVSNLTISAASGALNTLLLDHAGTSVPLHVLDVCSIGANGSLQNYYSSLQVDGSNGVFYGGSFLLADGGKLIQEGGLTVITPAIEVRNGSIDATNATMNLGTLNFGDVYTGTAGTVVQSGGTVLSAGLRIDIGGFTLMDNGTLYALDKTILYGGSFSQLSGANYCEVDQRGGVYHLYDGLLHGNDLHFTGNGNFFQHGGTAEFATMEIYGTQGGPNYQLEAGNLRCGNLDITGRYRQYGGTLTLTNGLFMPAGIFDFVGGTVLMPSMVISNAGLFNHFLGTNLVSGDVLLYNTGLLFQGGRFSSVNLGVGVGASVGQSSGSNEVNGVLSITGSYYLGGGILTVNGVWMRGTLTIAGYGGGNPAPLFVNNGLINFGGTLSVSSSQSSMGQLALSTNGTLALGSQPFVLRFANSSGLNWDANSTLIIDGWNSSLHANTHHIYFGSSASGLTAQQLSRIQFRNPMGHTGSFPAGILSTGELVPVGFLASQRTVTALVLEWAGGGVLQSSTNVIGPYVDLPASSPYTNLFTEPRRFLRLQ